VACLNNRKSVVRLLLQDPRVDASWADGNERTPLWMACYRDGHFEVVERLIASGKDLELHKKGTVFGLELSALEVAMESKEWGPSGKIILKSERTFCASRAPPQRSPTRPFVALVAPPTVTDERLFGTHLALSGAHMVLLKRIRGALEAREEVRCWVPFFFFFSSSFFPSSHPFLFSFSFVGVTTAQCE